MSYTYGYDKENYDNAHMLINICREYSDEELWLLSVDFNYSAVQTLANYVVHLEHKLSGLEDQVDRLTHVE